MKGWVPAAMAGGIVLAGLLLSAPARKPEDFTGQWYLGDAHAKYLFEDGLISRETDNGESGIAGAYIFCADKLLLYVTDVEGLEEERELYLVRRTSGDLLCGSKNSTEEVFFSRNRETVTVQP